MELDVVSRREGHVGEDIGLCLVEQAGESGQLGPQLIGHPSPLQLGGIGGLLGEGGTHEGRDDAAAALAGMGHDIPHEVNPASLPGGVHHFGDGGLDALVGVGDDQLHPAQAQPGEAAQERRPEGLCFGRADLHAQDLTAPIGVGADRDDGGRRDNAAVLADLDVIGVEIFTLQGRRLSGS
jgi:hypothetical protein